MINEKISPDVRLSVWPRRPRTGVCAFRRVAPSIVLSAMVALMVPGCGASSGSPHPVDPDTAADTLLTVLDGWKSGMALDAWRAQHSDITVQDMDWHFGLTLSDYEVLDGARAVDANLHCDVRLMLRDEQGTATRKTVTYLVSTSPRKTVFRQMIP